MIGAPPVEGRVVQRQWVDTHGFRDVMASFASGVTVTTTRAPSGEPVGITASSFTSLSLEPPLVLVCVARNAYSSPWFENCTGFGVSILAADQQDVAGRYATAGALKFTDEDHFDGAASGVPLIAGAIAHIECVRHDVVDGGDHIIVIGRVVHSALAAGDPMVSFNRKLGRFNAVQDRPWAAAPDGNSRR